MVKEQEQQAIDRIHKLLALSESTNRVCCLARATAPNGRLAGEQPRTRSHISVSIVKTDHPASGSCPKSAIECEGFWMQLIAGRVGGLNPRFIQSSEGCS
jgi:hypothetical protein